MHTAARGIAGVVLITCLAATLHAAEQDKPTLAKVYGEWRILVQPDKGAEYDRLIESEGLPLFRAAGGRMVGWWKTLIGNLYEHVTIWEYDDMAAFEKAIGYLGPDPKFAEFVAKRDPLLAGEESRFLSLVPGSLTPTLHDPAKFVIHETHRVPLDRQAHYLAFMQATGLPILKQYGFSPVGPMTTAVGKWSEITYLFRFESLTEREQLIARFMKTDDGDAYARRVSAFTEEVTTRLLIPAPFAKPPAPKAAGLTRELEPSSVLRHLERVSSRVWAAGFDYEHQSANCGFFSTASGTTLIDLPRGVAAGDFVAEVTRLTGQQPHRLLLTHASSQDPPLVRELVAAGVGEIVVSPQIAARLTHDAPSDQPLPLRTVAGSTALGDAEITVRFVPADGTAAAECAFVELPDEGVLFGGPLVVHGPRTMIVGSDTAEWVAALQQIEPHPHDCVIPGYGTWGDHGLITRQRRFLEELRSQVGYAIALGRPPEVLDKQVRLSPDFQVWMPYDNPVAEDLLYVYRELTAPNAPFGAHPPLPDDPRPQALVLIGDGPHEPQHLEHGLRPAFDATGIVPWFSVDVHALSAENLSRVDLLVVLRDGLMRPSDDPQSHYVWMTKEQQQAVVEFVDRGGGFLNLHNSLGLYPADGPYLQLARGKYIGHGPLERFRVEPVLADHPITRGIPPFSIADEQHTPVVDLTHVTQLFRSTSDSGVEGIAGWIYEPGHGRLCHLANGHTRDALGHPTYQRVLRNALQWCARQDVEGK